MLRVRKTQLDSLQFQLSTLLKENKERERREGKRREGKKRRRKGRFEANRSKLRFGNLTLLVYVYVHLKLFMMLN